MKKIYDGFDLELIFFTEDIVTTSPNGKDDLGSDPFDDDWGFKPGK